MSRTSLPGPHLGQPPGTKVPSSDPDTWPTLSPAVEVERSILVLMDGPSVRVRAPRSASFQTNPLRGTISQVSV